jgi:hypothetical protein
MQRIFNLSHADLDGIAAAIAVRTAHPEDHVRTEFTSLFGVHQALKRAIEARIPWDRIILSDVSIKVPTRGTVYIDDRQKQLVEELEGLIKGYVDDGGEFVVLDHHETALPMKFFYNAELHPDSILQVNGEDGKPISGSEIAGIYMMIKINLIEDMIISGEVMAVDDPQDDEEMFSVMEYDLNTLALFVIEFCRLAGDIDVWRDPFGFGGKLALALDLMDDNYGAMQDFQALITCAMQRDGNFEAALSDIPLLEYYYNMAGNKLAGALALAEKSCVEHSHNFHQIESKFFSSHCAEKIYSRTHGVVLMTYPTSSRKISFRCHTDITLNLAEFVKRFGGGGHERSAGMDIPEDMTLEDIVDEMLIALKKLN